MLSRGHYKEGVCARDLMAKHCPWGKSARERSPIPNHWLKSWLPDHQYLDPIDWFDKDHDLHEDYVDNYSFWRWHIKSGSYVWDLPPSDADAAIEELRKTRVKR